MVTVTVMALVVTAAGGSTAGVPAERPADRESGIATMTATTSTTAKSSDQAKGAKKVALDLVVRFRKKSRYGPRELMRDYPVTTVRRLLPSRGIFLFEPNDRAVARDRRRLKELARRISGHDGVRYAEADHEASLADDRYHSWPNGNPRDAGRDRRKFRTQPLAKRLQLGRVHRSADGAGTLVAVLDTGVARQHPALSGRLARGYDFVADDNDPAEVRGRRDDNGNGIVDEAYGHGTFVAGLVALVAPKARILPMRVLNSDGAGTVFLVGQAVLEAVDAGADVINISLGADEKVKSKFLDHAIGYAIERGVQVVAAAGNEGTEEPRYPATTPDVISVSSTVLDDDRLSDFANWGEWVDVAAPADRVLGPVPGGRYARWAGTSMAAPQVSGQIALLKSLGEKRADRQLEAIEKSARKVKDREIHHGAIDILASLGHVRSRS